MATPGKVTLPDTPCPNNLFISLIKREYFDALYVIEPSIFPPNWLYDVKRSPTSSWQALNINLLKYLNSKYSSQGLHIGQREADSFTMMHKILQNVLNNVHAGESSVESMQQLALIQGDTNILVNKLQAELNTMAKQVALLTGKRVAITISEV